MKLVSLFEEITHHKNPQLVLRLWLKQMLRVTFEDVVTKEKFYPIGVALRTNKSPMLVFLTNEDVRVNMPYEQLRHINEYFNFVHLPTCGLLNFKDFQPETSFAAILPDGEHFTSDQSLLKRFVQTMQYGPGTLNKSGKVNKNLFQAIYYMRENVPGKRGWKKLSDLYQSRSTSYSALYNTDCFIISKDREDVAQGGYAPTTKAVIMLNTKNQIVREVLSFIENFEATWQGRFSPYLNDFYQAYLRS